MGFGTGLSGLNAASKNLDVIGHNIANSNTTGMKASRSEFSEVYATAIGAGGGGGGGIGVTVANVAQIFTQGNIKITGNNLDMAINGDGFFRVKTPDGSYVYTRNGEFKMDNEGYVVTNNGSRLQGFRTNSEGVASDYTSSDIRLPIGGAISPLASSEINLTANLSASTGVQLIKNNINDEPLPLSDELRRFGTALNVYDTLGIEIPIQMYFVKVAENTWDVVSRLQPEDAALPAVETYVGQIEFDPANGSPSKFLLPDGTDAESGLSISILADSYSSGTPSSDQVISVNLGSGDSSDPFTLTQYGGDYAVYDIAQNGYARGELIAVAVGEDGVLTSRYSNGVSRADGQVMLARFRNVQGLEPLNGGYWAETVASGSFIPGEPMTGRFGLVRSGALEESNVDLTQELVNMIVAQRAYQANAQTIKTQDQIQQTLVNLR